MEQDAREQLMQELATGIAAQIRRKLGTAAPLPRNADSHMLVESHFTTLVRQSGVKLSPQQLKELYARVADVLLAPLPPSN